MPEYLLLATDDDRQAEEVEATLARATTVVRRVRTGAEVRRECEQSLPDLVLLDLQIGNQGGMAVCMDLRLEEGAGRLGHVPVLMLLDRRPDVFLAKRSGAEGWLIKPLDSIRLRQAARALLAGDTYHDATGAPPPDTPARPEAPATDAEVG
ncbi:MAG: response regulator transcription factor [Acidimicrobiia bacterium]|nr:response regulator transcription factor [Acidimicrobiia bacterium]